MKKHILVVSQYFFPEQFRINDICKEWVNRGHKVTVVTGIPNYPEGKFYKGYSWFKKRREIKDGINIIRIPIFARGKKSISLFLNYLSFVISGWFFTKITRIKADYVFTYEVSPIFQAKLGVWYGNRRKIPSIIYVMDLWPDNLEIIGGVKNKFILNKVSKITKKIYNNTSLILISSNSFIESIHEMGVDKEKIYFWPQYAEDFYIKKNIIDSIIEIIPQDEYLNLVFTGNIGFAQGLEILLDVAKILKTKGLKVRFNIIGDGRAKESLINQVKEDYLDEYFNFINKQKAEMIPYFIACCNAAILTLKNNKIFEKTIPAKLQSYMACGIPILANANGEVKQIIQESNSGYVSEAGNIEKFAEIIERFYYTDDNERKNFSNNAISYFNINYQKKKLMDELDLILDELRRK